MSSSETGRRILAGITAVDTSPPPPCDINECNRYRKSIDYECRRTHAKYVVICSMEGAVDPSCVAFCAQHVAAIKVRCDQAGWEPGHPIVYCDESGRCCQCICPSPPPPPPSDCCRCTCLLTTQIAIEGDTKAIDEVAVGDAVLVSNAETSDWSSAVVEFSDGTEGAIPEPEMVCVTVVSGEQLIVTRDQVVLIADQQGQRWLKQAERIAVGDQLIRQDSSVVAVTDVSSAPASGAVHHISTGTAKPQSLDGHILLMDGFACGDYAVQLYWDELPPGLVYPNHGLLPVADFA